MTKVNASNIQKKLQQQFPDVQVFSFIELDSTSLYLKERSKSSLIPAFCITERQTQGYGQQLRPWQSDERSLSFSLLLHFNLPLHKLNGLTQLISLKLIESLSSYSEASFKVKWPNDLYVGSVKVGGILVESVAYTENDCWLVIGIGLNNGSNLSVTDSYTGAPLLTGSVELPEEKKIAFLESLIQHLITLSNNFTESLFKQYQMNYRLVDFFELDQSVIVYDIDTKKPGFYKGLTEYGELLVEVDGALYMYRSGNTSVRPI